MLLNLFMCIVFVFSGIAAVFAQDNILKNPLIGDWNLDLGVGLRERYEYKEDFDFNDDAKDSGSLFFNRLNINAAMKYKDSYEIFIEGLDARVGSYRLKKPAQIEELDLHQAYLQMNEIMDSNFALKLGRQKLEYGKGRIVAAPTWSNLINAFDALVIRYKDQALYWDGLIGYLVKYDRGNPNHINGEEMLNGLYMGYQKDKQSPLFEVYTLNLIDNNKKSTGHIHRYNVGLRTKGRLGERFSYDVEIPYQFGDYGIQDIQSYALHLDASYALEQSWKPTLSLEFNLANGDNNAGDNVYETFVPLYQSTHAPYGIMDFFRWQNIRELAAGLSVTPKKQLTLNAGINFFWLDDVNDYWYNSSGSKVRSSINSNADSFVGTEASLVGKYELTRGIQLEAGYAHFFTGGYVKDTGRSNDADWLYSQITTKF